MRRLLRPRLNGSVGVGRTSPTPVGPQPTVTPASPGSASDAAALVLTRPTSRVTEFIDPALRTQPSRGIDFIGRLSLLRGIGQCFDFIGRLSLLQGTGRCIGFIDRSMLPHTRRGSDLFAWHGWSGSRAIARKDSRTARINARQRAPVTIHRACFGVAQCRATLRRRPRKSLASAPSRS